MADTIQHSFPCLKKLIIHIVCKQLVGVTITYVLVIVQFRMSSGWLWGAASIRNRMDCWGSRRRTNDFFKIYLSIFFIFVFPTDLFTSDAACLVHNRIGICIEGPHWIFISYAPNNLLRLIHSTPVHVRVKWNTSTELAVQSCYSFPLPDSRKESEVTGKPPEGFHVRLGTSVFRFITMLLFSVIKIGPELFHMCFRGGKFGGGVVVGGQVGHVLGPTRANVASTMCAERFIYPLPYWRFVVADWAFNAVINRLTEDHKIPIHISKLWLWGAGRRDSSRDGMFYRSRPTCEDLISHSFPSWSRGQSFICRSHHLQGCLFVCFLMLSRHKTAESHLSDPAMTFDRSIDHSCRPVPTILTYVFESYTPTSHPIAFYFMHR